MISEDAIAEFRVNSQLYTAETGGATDYALGNSLGIMLLNSAALRPQIEASIAELRAAHLTQRQIDRFYGAASRPQNRQLCLFINNRRISPEHKINHTVVIPGFLL